MQRRIVIIEWTETKGCEGYGDSNQEIERDFVSQGWTVSGLEANGFRTTIRCETIDLDASSMPTATAE